MSDDLNSLAWRGPVAAWAIMLAGVGGMVFSASAPAGPVRAALAMSASGVALAALALGLIGLGRASKLNRLLGGAGFAFVAILFLLSFIDLTTRLR